MTEEQKSNQKDDATERLRQEHAAVSDKLAKLRAESEKLGKEVEDKLKPEILEAEIELIRLSGMLGQIGL